MLDTANDNVAIELTKDDIRQLIYAGQVEQVKHHTASYSIEKFTSLIKYIDYTPFRRAVENGHCQMIDYLFERVPEHVQKMIAARGHESIWTAASEGYPDIVQRLLDRVAPECRIGVISAHEYAAFRMAAARGQLAVLKLLVDRFPEQVQNMIRARDFAAYDQAKRKNHPLVMDYIMSLVAPQDALEMLANCWKSDDELRVLIETAKTKYAAVEEKISDTAILWIAEQAGRAPIYVFGTLHLTSFDFKDYLLDLIIDTLGKVQTSFTEVVEHLFAPSKSIDELVLENALSMGKQVKALEDDQCRKLMLGEQMYQECQITLFQLAKDDEFVRLYSEYYLNNSWPAIIPGAEDFKVSTPLRNMFWMEKILQESISQNACLVAVGMYHNIGIHGLPNLLANQGYQLTPLVKQAPKPRSSSSNNHPFFTHAVVNVTSDPNELDNSIADTSYT